MLIGEVLSKIQISGSLLIDVVIHALWNFREAIFLANISLSKQSLTYCAKTYPHILHTCISFSPFFSTTTKKYKMSKAIFEF